MASRRSKNGGREVSNCQVTPRLGVDRRGEPTGSVGLASSPWIAGKEFQREQ